MLQRLLSALWGPAESQASRHRGRRLLVLAAAIGVPAVAAPAEWKTGPLLTRDETALVATPAVMPFEEPGQSFPGSAFYFLEDAPEMALALPALDPTEAPLDTAELGKRIDSGPAARAFLSTGTGIDKARALKCMTQAIYYEAASESEAGQRAVAQVVLNRVAHSAWPNSVCGVVFQGSQRTTGCQFTFTCDGSLARKPSVQGWSRAQQIAARALAGEVYSPIGLATHYHTHWVNPYWAKTLDYAGSIGAHRFYRWRGNAGKPGAFASIYSGVETVAVSALRDDGPSYAAVPVLPTTASYGAVAAAAAPAMPAAQPVSETSGPYVGAGRVKDEFSRVGQWKTQPGTAASKPAE